MLLIVVLGGLRGVGTAPGFDLQPTQTIAHHSLVTGTLLIPLAAELSLRVAP